MASPAPTDVLLALLGSHGGEPVSGEQLLERLSGAGRPTRASKVLVTLLGLETAGLVGVDRSDGYCFWLTDEGTSAAYAAGHGEAVAATVFMVDLVGFTAFTETAGDDAAQHAATALTRLTAEAVRGSGGRVVKSLGDGVLGLMAPEADPVEPLQAIHRRMQGNGAARWSLRAAAHRGRPVSHGDDIFGADVNLVSRLCAAAAPDELVLTCPTEAGAEQVVLRGVANPVAVARVPLVAETAL
ncbi:MAG: adenylate/guanylate cyclase domain-containing protein [Acidimicrobiia bacterium]|nr:adenylate/guanylate cyclase domain-containing protein [Acidimicrobiia bacterium]